MAEPEETSDRPSPGQALLPAAMRLAPPSANWVNGSKLRQMPLRPREHGHRWREHETVASPAVWLFLPGLLHRVQRRRRNEDHSPYLRVDIGRFPPDTADRNHHNKGSNSKAPRSCHGPFSEVIVANLAIAAVNGSGRSRAILLSKALTGRAVPILPQIKCGQTGQVERRDSRRACRAMALTESAKPASRAERNTICHQKRCINSRNDPGRLQ